MGKGVLSDDHPLTLGMTGFWGTQLVNDTCLAADVIFAIGTRFKEADSSSWYRDYTFNIPDTALIHIDIEPSEISRDLPRRDRRRRRRRGGAAGAQPGRPRAVSRWRRPSRHPPAHRRLPDGVRREQPADGDQRRLPDDAGADPRRHPQRAPRRRLHHHRRRMEQERRRPAVPDPHARHRAHAGRLRHDGVRSVGRHRRQAGCARSHRGVARRGRRASARTRRCSPPPSSTTSASSGWS